MSRNGSGTYSLPAGNPVVTGTTISSSWANNTMTDIASALTDSVAADGQTPMTGNLDLNSNKIVNLADPTLVQDAATKNYSDNTFLAKASNLSDVANATTARTNISAAQSGANSDITSLTGLTTPLSQAQGGTGTTTGYYGFKNRIINGAMVIDQRNAGASVTPADGTYTLDRWNFNVSQSSKLTCQQSSTAPTGFTNSLKVTSSSAYSVTSGDYFVVQQRIEGYNVADLAWGTANAKTITLSFWVYSSLTGTFNASISNGAFNRSYPVTYTISSANTWEQKSITITGDTTGTWTTTNGAGMVVFFNLGSGSSMNGTNATWAAGWLTGVSGATSVVGTNGATFYITGVQLEVGSTATSFDYRPYGTELMLCQRYLPAYRATGSGNQDVGNGLCNSTTAAYFAFDFVVQPRVEPTGVTISSAGHFGAVNAAFSATNLFTGLTFSVGSLKRALLSGTGSSGLVQGDATMVRSQSASAYILFDGCEL